MYDLLIKSGRVIDPAQKIDGTMDVAVSGDKIAAVARDIPLKDAVKTIDAKDKIVAPGLIDMHCHVFDGVVRNGAPVDMAGVRQGVTTVVDAGSVGQANFSAFPRYVIPRQRTTVYCFLHIGSLGMSVQPEPHESWEIDVNATESVLKAYPGLIKGIKLRLVGSYIARDGLNIFKTAKKVAKNAGLPIMVHIGDTDKLAPASLTPQVLSLMEKGDILSHGFTSQQGATMRPDGTFIPEFKAALSRGVVFDIAHGRYNFNYEVAKRGMAQGIMPDVISSDLTSYSMASTVFGLPVTMSKFLGMGLSLNEIIAMTTINPAKALGIAANTGSLKSGMDADVSILELAPGKWQLADAEKQVLMVPNLIKPSITIKAGKVVQPKLFALPENKT